MIKAGNTIKSFRLLTSDWKVTKQNCLAWIPTKVGKVYQYINSSLTALSDIANNILRTPNM